MYDFTRMSDPLHDASRLMTEIAGHLEAADKAAKERDFDGAQAELFAAQDKMKLLQSIGLDRWIS